MFEKATRVNGDRRVTLSFDGPIITDDQHLDDEWRRRIKVTCTHSKDTKRFEATVWRVAVAHRDGYTMERFAFFSGDNATVKTRPVPRYSANALELFVLDVIELCEEIVADESIESLAAVLLREALSFIPVEN